MREVKYALAFILGGIYASSWWVVFTVDGEGTALLAFLMAVSRLVAFLGTGAIAILVILWLWIHWDEK